MVKKVHHKNQDHTDLSLFKNRLWLLMEQNQIFTAKELARRLYDNKLIAVDSRTKDVYRKQYSPYESIEKRIQTHLNSDETDKLQGKYVSAYCKFFGCSSDFLFGNIEHENHDLQFICDSTGLSSKAVKSVCGLPESSTKQLSKLLSNEIFIDILQQLSELIGLSKIERLLTEQGDKEVLDCIDDQTVLLWKMSHEFTDVIEELSKEERCKTTD